MLTAAALKQYTGEEGALDLLRALGYPVAPVECDPHEWRSGGVTIPWNGDTRLRLVSRLRRLDLFLLSGNVREEWIAEFMRSYRQYNLMTKSAVLYCADESLSIFDLSPERTLRRLDVDLARPSSHAVDRLNLLARGEEESLPRIFDRALDREQLTREFFQRFRAAVRDVAAVLARDFPDDDAEGEALLILSRLLFLSFVQEKGWLGGERRFLVDRLEHEMRRGREFFSSVLLPLFFGCLNTPLHERTLSARKLGRVPYLNGGLFEPSAFELRHPELHLPNELMQRVLEEVFERFDFRIDESDAAGTHIDPEMLGRVFESLMASDERAASGSFYTPKEVVDVLTERAITEWLGDGGIEKLQRITVLDPACGSGAFLLSALSVIERLWRRLAGDDVPRDLRRRIVAGSLYGVDLKPEAVRLCELRLWLAIVSASDAAIEEVEPLPNLDRNILQGNSLLSPTDFLGDGRMDIYRDWLYALRAQRDLVERYRSAPFAQRPALYRVIRGNDQRLASELLARTIDLAEEELRVASTPQRDLFGRVDVTDAERCRELQERIAEAKGMLEKVEEGTLDFFSFDVHFAPLLAGGGFDVVAGNPPWVRNSRIDARAKRMLADRFAPPGHADPQAIRDELAKIEALMALARDAPCTKRTMLLELLRGEPTLIFTGSVATARDLHAHILGSGLITSKERSREAVLRAFVEGKLDVVVSTDMAAEGLNLQRAAVVVHYDIPWNPVKLDQRNGRAHRIGQARESVRAIYFLPEKRDTGIVAAVARKNRVRRRAMQRPDPATRNARPTLRPRITREAAVTCLANPPDVLMRRHKAGIEILIREGCRTTDLLALAAQELEGVAQPALRPGR